MYIVKYNTAGVLTQEVSKWWEVFLDRFVETYGSVPQSSPTWYLDKLKHIRSVCQHPQPSSPHVSEKIMSMHKKEREPQQKVIKYKKHTLKLPLK